MTLKEEVEALFAGLVTCIGLFLCLLFAPILLKFSLLGFLLVLPKFGLV